MSGLREKPSDTHCRWPAAAPRPQRVQTKRGRGTRTDHARPRRLRLEFGALENFLGVKLVAAAVLALALEVDMNHDVGPAAAAQAFGLCRDLGHAGGFPGLLQVSEAGVEAGDDQVLQEGRPLGQGASVDHQGQAAQSEQRQLRGRTSEAAAL